MSIKSSICGPSAADCPSQQNLNFISNLVQFSSSCVLQAACHNERHVSQKAVSFIHDVLTEVLTSWAERPHFHFNEALFRPFEHIMQLELCDEDVQDQVGAVFDNGCFQPLGGLRASCSNCCYCPANIFTHSCTEKIRDS